MMTETKEFISKGRLDALTDGVFAFAMTLLVVNLASAIRVYAGKGLCRSLSLCR